MLEDPNRWCQGSFYKPAGANPQKPRNQPTQCCATGALEWASIIYAPFDRKLLKSAVRYLETSARNQRMRLYPDSFTSGYKLLDTHTNTAHLIVLNDGKDGPEDGSVRSTLNAYAGVMGAYKDAIGRATARGN